MGFEVGAPNNAVLEVGGQEPEDFATIVRRYISQSAVVKPSLGNKLKASANFLQIILTPVPDLDEYEQSLGLPVITQAAYAPDFSPWMNSHSIEGLLGDRGR